MAGRKNNNDINNQQSRPRDLSIIGFITLGIGLAYVALAAVFIPYPGLATDYIRSSFESIGVTQEDELALWGIMSGWTFAVAGAFGAIIGLGVLKAKRWSWDAAAVYNIIFVLSSAYAFLESAALPDSYLAVGSVGAIVILFRRSTKAHFGRVRIPQK
jgi:hypothetical protein